MKKAALVVGARPQFIKAAPLINVMRRSFQTVLIHTGQHYDFMMSGNFFKELDLPRPDYHLNLEFRSPGKMTGNIIAGLESIFEFEKPDFVVVIGDTNSTLAGAISAAHLRLRIAHIEAGVRSIDAKLPEQINRVVTDAISDCFFCPTPTAVENLKNEGKLDNIFDTGDIIYDCLRLIENNIPDRPSVDVDIPQRFALMTLHRAEAVDNKPNLSTIMKSLESSPYPVIFTIHPRTAKMIEYFELENSIPKNVTRIEPVGYANLLSLIKSSEFVITDSGGVQRESVFLDKPVCVPRPETEWIDFVNLGRVKVTGYNFDLSNLHFEKVDAGDELSALLKPASINIAELLKAVF